jgi:ribonucleoside-diphosphate reductase alpha chain
MEKLKSRESENLNTPHSGRIQIPPQKISTEIWGGKYRRGPEHGAKDREESQSDTQKRVSKALTKGDDPKALKSFVRFVFDGKPSSSFSTFEDLYMWAHAHGMILAGRPNSALGTAIKATLINCFVQPIADTSLGEVNGKPGIMPALAQAFETLRRGGGVGYNFSAIRPKDAKVASTNSTSSGPVSYMELYGQSCATVCSAGQRRGAQMAILDCTHPDIRAFIHCKDDVWTEEGQKSPLAKFNISVNASNALIEAALNDAEWELFHEAEPHPELHPNAYRREDGMWVYEVVKARELMDDIVGAVYNGHGEPGVFLGDTVNNHNPLNYAEFINCTNPCAEQSLPDYGCCDLGQVNLTALVRDPFTDNARLDFDHLKQVSRILQRALDNILDLTLWPLDEQRQEAQNKRRVGVGFLGLGSALAMLGLKYDSEEGRAMAEKIIQTQATACYESSIELAKERGSFPLLDREKHVQAPIVQRLPEHIRKGILEHGLRNSHSLSIAPTGTIAVAFADNASNGIEPPFSWVYRRRVLNDQGEPEIKEAVEDYAFRVWRHLGCPGGDAEIVDKAVREEDFETLQKQLPESFRSAEEIKVGDHLAMMAVVQPYVDASISKTVNVPTEYPYEDFKEIYFEAHRMGLKSVAAFRPKPQGASVLIRSTKDAPPESEDPDRRIRVDKPRAIEAAIRFTGRPQSETGHEGITFDIRSQSARMFLTINKTEDGVPFEVLVDGAEAPRGANVLAKQLSLDMHTSDRGWVISKLDSLAKVNGGDPVPVVVGGEKRIAPSHFAAMAMLIRDYYQRLGIVPALDSGPILDARLCIKEPKSIEGGAARAFDVLNPATGDDLTVFVKEFDINGLGRWPLSIWLSGKYPRSWAGIAKMLSLDMQVADPAWIGRKLRAMLNVPEHGGDFMARMPGSKKSRTWPSTWAYIAQILVHRYAEIGLLNEQGYPLDDAERVDRAVKAIIDKGGAQCPDCGNQTLVKRDGCEVCDSCGYMGSCG